MAQPASGLFCGNSHRSAEPGRKVRLGARGIGALAGGGFFRVVQPLSFNALGRINRREQPEVYIHRLEGAGPLVSRLDMPARDVIDQRAMGRRCRRYGKIFSAALRRRHAPRHDAHGGTFHIALDHP